MITWLSENFGNIFAIVMNYMYHYKTIRSWFITKSGPREKKLFQHFLKLIMGSYKTVGSGLRYPTCVLIQKYKHNNRMITLVLGFTTEQAGIINFSTRTGIEYSDDSTMVDHRCLQYKLLSILNYIPIDEYKIDLHKEVVNSPEDIHELLMNYETVDSPFYYLQSVWGHLAEKHATKIVDRLIKQPEIKPLIN